MEDEDYSLLKDLKFEIESEDGMFTFCFWVYVMNYTFSDCNLVRQVHEGIPGSLPFLYLNEHKKLKLFPLLQLTFPKEASDPGNSCIDIPHADMETEFPLEKWVHVGCEVSTDYLRLYIDGRIVGDKHLTSPLHKSSSFTFLRKITGVTIDGDTGVQGYIYGAEALTLTSSIKDCYATDRPIQLAIDYSSASDIEEDTDGIWNIVGGKASCRRHFSLDVVLLDALGQSVNRELEVVASLLYADTGASVEKTSDQEAPLLTSFDGYEYDSSDRPNKLLQGRASFKLKISQLSSKCDNRLFCISFFVPQFWRYPFLEALSRPIHCISRNRNPRASTPIWKKSTSSALALNGCQSPGRNDGCLELHHNTVCEAKPSPSSKRVRLGQENISAAYMSDYPMGQHEDECNSHVQKGNQDGLRTSIEGRTENNQADKSRSDSRSIEAESMGQTTMLSSQGIVSDSNIFSYCLGNLNERSLMLREISTSVSVIELAAFADQVSLYSGCSHHRQQIVSASRLIEEGARVWNLISKNNDKVLWASVIHEIEAEFTKIACCDTRSLMQQDFEILRKIAGCQEYLAQENFEKLWCWLFPVALTISRNFVNALWKSASPRWIEGFITKEEAESSLQVPLGRQEAGTFILRFPTSRSWPHPDAGSLVVTYVGSNYTIRHRLLSFDYIYRVYEKEMNMIPVQDMLLNDPELSRLGRVIRGR